MFYIGIDLGTSSVKLLLMEEDGTIVKTVSRVYQVYFPNPGWSEQDPADWYRESLAGLKELTDGIDKSAIAGIRDIGTLIVYGTVPFNFIKGVIVSVITTLLYKKVSPLLHR